MGLRGSVQWYLWGAVVFVECSWSGGAEVKGGPDVTSILYGDDVQEVVYRGAVLETVPVKNPELTPVQNMLENVQTLFQYGLRAKEQGVDIIVFPEYAVYSWPPHERSNFIAYTQYVPDPSSKVSPCDLDTPFHHDQVVRNMSCIAKELDMYIVFNMPERVDCNPEEDSNCPEDNHYFYNINVVFDRLGVVISKWRKLHLFREPWFNVGNYEDEAAIFTTDFGVTFTQHICFDTLFYRPSLSNIEKYGIKDLVMPTSWVDYLPFSTAPQAQYSYSRMAGVNLLVAGRHLPIYTATGSGIYTAATDITKSINVYDDTQGTKLLVQDIQTTASRKNIKRPSSRPASRLPLELEGKQSQAKVSEHHGFIYEDLSGYFFEHLSQDSSGPISGTFQPNGQEGESIEYSLDWKFEGDGDYFFLTNSGPAGFGEYILYRQIGALLYCPDGQQSCGTEPLKKPTKATFHHFNLTLQFDTPHLLPAVIDQDFALISEDKWDYTTRRDGDKHTASIVLKEPLDFLYSAAILGRLYDKDPFCDTNKC